MSDDSSPAVAAPRTSTAEALDAARRIVETTEAHKIATDRHIRYRQAAKNDDDLKRIEDEYRASNNAWSTARLDHKTGEDHVYAVARALLAGRVVPLGKVTLDGTINNQ